MIFFKKSVEIQLVVVRHPQVFLCVFYKHHGDKSEVVDLRFSALIHVESELNSCIGPLNLQT